VQTNTVAKTLVFNELGELLVLQRSSSDAHRPGGFDFPGGAVDEGEGIITGAVREVREETGLRVADEALQLVYATCKTARYDDGDKRINIVWLGFVTHLPTGQTVKLSHEHDRYAWLSLKEFLLASDHPAHHSLINYLRNNKIAAELWDI
jgi:8-oxo-dGTP diphosphatase